MSLGPPATHRALLHDGPTDLAKRVAPELADALDRDEPVHVSLTVEEWAALRSELGERADRAVFQPADDRYVNPGRAMASLHEFIQHSIDAGAETTWSIGSVRTQGDPVTDARWARYESAVDVVLRGVPVHGICAYDRTRSPISVIDAVRRCHTVVDEPGSGSAACLDHEPYLHELARWPHRSTPPHLELWDAEPSKVRAALTDLCRQALSREQLSALHLVATELVTNGMRHGDRPIGLQVWNRGDDVVLEAWDHGPGIVDPYADFRPRRQPGPGGGYGLWLVGQLSDQVSIGREDGRTVVVAVLHAR